ncbi:Predicted arabinose efflux permease, MFS family [Blastococcus aggregatus]|uniref:Predicted arabinose efflux permease, MFS family n=1 Tax=Blastococcus aggregatus TaxID=38502 RepID=A0A285UYR8_9ACTN|nr:MFS transporter [Blastococcus aggregatus]SOC46933.1 Predicted arabinose efflux permease, MFS family [Blastococcus aggregatus]
MRKSVPEFGYRRLLQSPQVRRPFVATALGRLSYGMLSLALLLTVAGASSYSTAGAALGVFAITTLTMPAKSRLVDRFGQPRVLPALSVVLATALILLALAAEQPSTRGWTFVVLAAIAGLAAPPLGPSMRAVWAELIGQPDQRQRAYALDGLVEELAYALGPLAVTGVIAVTGASTSIIATALLNLGATLGLATAPVVRRLHAATATRRPRARQSVLRIPGLLMLIAVTAAIGFGTGPLTVAVAARISEFGRPQLAGVLLAVLSVSSAVGGLLWGRSQHRRRRSVQLQALAVVLAAGSALAAVAPSAFWLAGALAVIGIASSPALIVAFLGSDQLSPSHHRTEATTWISTGNNGGVALGSTLAGVLIDLNGATTVFVCGAATLCAVALALSGRQRSLNGSEADRTVEAAQS